MFTGLVTAIGTVSNITPRGGGLDLSVRCPWHDMELGESVAVRGACLTVTGHASAEFTVHVVATSLERTCFGELVEGSRVNLERALRVGDRMGGHWVQGHVDAIGTVSSTTPSGTVHLMEVRVPESVAVVSIPLGSITIDGVSLTVNAVRQDTVQVAIVPHTLQHTTLADLQVGDRVHLEGDIVGKHVRALVAPWTTGRELQ